jgi:hypothetical protein
MWEISWANVLYGIACFSLVAVAILLVLAIWGVCRSSVVWRTISTLAVIFFAALLLQFANGCRFGTPYALSPSLQPERPWYPQSQFE